MGKWRYIHIDDRIPCRQSGRVNFCRNQNPNEVFAMIIEKAYAKLHGCYESISYGLLEKILPEFTASGAVETLKLEKMPLNSLCDDIWEYLSKGISENRLIGCRRSVQNSHSESASLRKGITPGLSIYYNYCYYYSHYYSLFLLFSLFKYI